jgi:outer membrane protein OmpA-like peptidoglycan-associated protein
MRFRWMTILLLVALGGCSRSGEPQMFSVYFQPYSAELDQQAHESVDAAASFAGSHPGLPVALTGYSAPPDPKLDVEGLSDKRAQVVRQALVSSGVRADRISTVANGITDPKSLPTVAVRRVDISVGQ